MKPRNTRVQWPLSSPGTSWVPSDWRSENAGSSRGCGNSVTVSIAGPAGACPAKNFCEASRPRPAARATTRMIRVVRLNMAEALFTQYLKCGHDNRATVILPGPAAQPRPRAAMTDELHTIIDLIRYGASRFNAAGLTFGHSYDNAIDEATQLVLHALHLPHDLGPAYGQARVTLAEKEEVLALFPRRIEERIPASYLTGSTWFAGLSFTSDPRALVTRSPIVQSIQAGLARKRVVPGNGVYVRVAVGGRRNLNNTKKPLT